MRISDWSSDVCSSDLARPDRRGVIMGRESDAGKDLAAERGRGDAAGAQPYGAVRGARHRAVAGKGELAHARALRPLEHDAAHAVRKAGVAHPVEPHLRDPAPQIGSAACRERVCKYVVISVGAGSLTKKTKTGTME